MKAIERKLSNFINGRGPKLTEKELIDSTNKEGNFVIVALFKVINKELDNVTGEGNLIKIRELFKYVKVIIENCDTINRKILIRKLSRLDEKIDRIKTENRKKFLNVKNAYKELKKTQEELYDVEDDVIEKDSKPYEFISYLIEDIKDINYLEYIFLKMPNMINVKDKYGNTLFHNLIEKYISYAIRENEDEIKYYCSVITLILSQKDLLISSQEKRDYLEIIYKAINKISIGKRRIKKNKEKIDWLKELVEGIKGAYEKHPSIEALANKYNIDVYFTDDVLKKATLVKIPKEGEITDREEYKDYIITIDKENVKEIDDALSCRKLENGHFLLGVHIASILGYYSYESDIVQEAISRNRSIYLPRKYQIKENEFQKAIPIFPYDFSADKASLLEGEKRLARSYIFEIDAEGNIVNERFLKTIITVNKNNSYEEINEVLRNGSENQELNETVFNLQNVANILDKKYKALDLYEQIKENTDDYSDLRVKQVGAEKIVYKTMVLTGNRVAEFFSKNKYPCLYRVHEINEDNVKKIQEMIENLTKTYDGENFKKLYQLIEGVYPKGWYGMSGPHNGLGLLHYCHCTSGLRRAADIVVEHALEVCYDNNPTEKDIYDLSQEIEKKVNEINSKQEPIEWFVKDYKRTYRRTR